MSENDIDTRQQFAVEPDKHNPHRWVVLSTCSWHPTADDAQRHAKQLAERQKQKIAADELAATARPNSYVGGRLDRADVPEAMREQAEIRWAAIDHNRKANFVTSDDLLFVDPTIEVYRRRSLCKGIGCPRFDVWIHVDELKRCGL